MNTFDDVVNNDPTLKYFIREAKIDYFNTHQLELRAAAIKIALNNFVESITP